ncbi:hypothetical protein AN641_03075 [Candidatus Epulonipiscioides gigas]|nr:hypothetical protein AN641_03075 [Epulopiscium sp. SCG-C07WGA-EpuloA2]
MSLNTFINLEGNIIGYSQNDKPLTGHVTIGMPGRVKLYVDNLKDAETKNYVCYLMSKTKNKAVRLGEITPPSQNKQSTFKIDLKNIGGKGLMCQDIDGVAVVIEGASVGNTDIILSGYDGATYTPSPLLQQALPKVASSAYRKQPKENENLMGSDDTIYTPSPLLQQLKENGNLIGSDGSIYTPSPLLQPNENESSIKSENELKKPENTKGFMLDEDIHAAIKEVDKVLGIQPEQQEIYPIKQNIKTDIQEIDKLLSSTNVVQEADKILQDGLNKKEDSIQILDMRKMIEEIVEQSLHNLLLKSEQEHTFTKQIIALIKKTIQETECKIAEPNSSKENALENSVIEPNSDEQILEKIQKIMQQIQSMSEANKNKDINLIFNELMNQIKHLKDMLASKPMTLPNVDSQTVSAPNTTILIQPVPIFSPKPTATSNEDTEANSQISFTIPSSTLKSAKLPSTSADHNENLENMLNFIDSIKTLISHSPEVVEKDPLIPKETTAQEVNNPIKLEAAIKLMNLLLSSTIEEPQKTSENKSDELDKLDDVSDLTQNTSDTTNSTQRSDCGCDSSYSQNMNNNFNATAALSILTQILSNKKTHVTEEEIKKIKSASNLELPKNDEAQNSEPINFKEDNEQKELKDKSALLSELLFDKLNCNQKETVEQLIKSGFQSEKANIENNLENFIKRIEAFKKALNDAALNPKPQTEKNTAPQAQEKVIGKYNEKEADIISKQNLPELEEVIEIPVDDLLLKQEAPQIGDSSQKDIDAPIVFDEKEIDDLDDNIEIDLDSTIKLEEAIKNDANELKEQINTEIEDLQAVNDSIKTQADEEPLKKNIKKLECNDTEIEVTFIDMIDEGEPIDFVENFDRLNELINNNITNKPFGNKLPVDWVYISLMDLKSIPQISDEWANQLKVVEAYEKYEHFILGKKHNINKFYVGIPDHSIRSKRVTIDIQNVIEFVYSKTSKQKFNGYWIAHI